MGTRSSNSVFIVHFKSRSQTTKVLLNYRLSHRCHWVFFRYRSNKLQCSLAKTGEQIQSKFFPNFEEESLNRLMSIHGDCTWLWAWIYLTEETAYNSTNYCCAGPSWNLQKHFSFVCLCRGVHQEMLSFRWNLQIELSWLHRSVIRRLWRTDTLKSFNVLLKRWTLY